MGDLTGMFLLGLLFGFCLGGGIVAIVAFGTGSAR